MNLVLADTEEFRRTRRKTKTAGDTQQITESEERRAIGLTIVRGAQVISLSVDGPPPADPSARLGATSGGASTAATLAAGPGIARPAGRGLPIGLTGPAPGVGGPGPGFGGFPGGPPFAGGPPGFPGRGGPPGGPRKCTFLYALDQPLTITQLDSLPQVDRLALQDLQVSVDLQASLVVVGLQDLVDDKRKSMCKYMLHTTLPNLPNSPVSITTRQWFNRPYGAAEAHTDISSQRKLDCGS